MQVDARRKIVIVILALLLCGGLLVLHQEGQRPAPTAVEAPRVESASIKSAALDRAAVEQLLPSLATAKWTRYDPLAVVRAAEDRSETINWPEHIGGKFTLRTNNLGFREDERTVFGPPHGTDLRVLVLGDSHTFGLVANGETFPNLLEKRLAPKLKFRRCEVLNAGVSGTGPFEQRALLGVLLDMQPQLVLCVLYTGNDFINAQAFSDFETRRARTPLPRDAQKRFEVAREDPSMRARMAQNTSQVHTFTYCKGEAEAALLATTQCYREMAEYCAERGARLMVAILPPKEEVDLTDLSLLQPVRGALRLCDDDFAVDRRLAERFAEVLRADGIEVVDLLPALLQPGLLGRRRPLYWTSDQHLAVDGHAVVATALEQPVLAALRDLRGKR